MKVPEGTGNTSGSAVGEFVIWGAVAVGVGELLCMSDVSTKATAVGELCWGVLVGGGIASVGVIIQEVSGARI